MYNGHKNYNAWNVSLWIMNDEFLYNVAKWCIKVSENRTQAVEKFMRCLGSKSTPDGVNYTKTNIRLAFNRFV